MKLTMKNQYSFQKAMGYGDDPVMMDADAVKSHLALWQEIVGSIAQLNGPTAKRYHDELVQLESFLNELGSCSEIEYEQPLETYEYIYGVEYFKYIYVTASSPEEADRLAEQEVHAIERPAEIDGMSCYSYWLDQSYGNCNRIIER